jgi:pyruvate/2-oxoglutarate/acetoin dehydrogenase E1 component
MSTTQLTYAWAINHALAEEMERDPRVFVMGQDVGRMGGVFGVTRGLFDRFGAERVRDVSIVEHFIVGGAVGAALAGLRP